MTQNPGKPATGIDTFCSVPLQALRSRRIALVSAASMVDAKGESVVDVVARCAPDSLKAIWSLQHGFWADLQDNMKLSESFIHPRLEIPVRSLYGDLLVPPEAWLEGIDALVVDVFDVGTRVYTFLNHLVMVMRHMSGRGVDLVVLDRPNPLGGVEMEGMPAEPEYFSIVAQLPVPMRHGLTAGEFLTAARGYHGLEINVEVIPVPNWKREREWAGYWTYPSPNMPTPTTAAVYPGAVMLEGTNLSEGRGTTRPFELVGAPWLDNEWLNRRLRDLGHEGAVTVPLGFKPEFGKFAGCLCRGILVTPSGNGTLRSFGLYYDLIRLIRERHAGEFAWQVPPYEFEYERLPIDMICGGRRIRDWIEAGRPFAAVAPEIDAAIDSVRSITEPHRLYE